MLQVKTFSNKTTGDQTIFRGGGDQCTFKVSLFRKCAIWDSSEAEQVGHRGIKAKKNQTKKKRNTYVDFG